MFYTDVQALKPTDFKRLTGVIPATFLSLCDALEKHLPSFGRPPKLRREDRLLMTLMYWREYRTQFHIAQTYGLSEACVSRTIRAVEDALLRSGAFTLPGKKALVQSQWQLQVVVVDATECPVERPQKSKSARTVAKRSATRKKPRS
jgi:hypothetical protein